MKHYILSVVSVLSLIAMAACGGSSGSSGNGGTSSGTDTSETFTNGGVSLMASLSESGSTKTSTITDSSGETVVTAAVTVNGVSLTSPDHADAITTTFSEALTEMPSNHAVNMLAAYIAGQLTLNASLSARCDSPGCDWFPDTQCTLGCCADHDLCYDENSCGASSWLLVTASSECINCNGLAEICILRACSGVDSSRSTDRCYDNHCHEFYDCGSASCECTSPCASVSPSTCGNGTCETGETSENCPGDCVDGTSVSACCVSSGGCPDETTEVCGESCCCCGAGYVCSNTTDRCATSR